MTTNIYELVYDPIKGRDVAHPMKINFDPSKYTSREGAAKAMHKALQEFAEKYSGYSDNVYLWAPDVAETSMTGYKAWTICWEEGPFEWSISTEVSGPWGYCEPYNGFILTFVS